MQLTQNTRKGTQKVKMKIWNGKMAKTSTDLKIIRFSITFTLTR